MGIGKKYRNNVRSVGGSSCYVVITLISVLYRRGEFLENGFGCAANTCYVLRRRKPTMYPIR